MVTTEKTSGSNLTPIAEYSETAMVMADLRKRHEGVVYDVATPKQMKLAKEARAEIRGYRVALEKTRVEIKAPALERCRQIDSEAKRLTAGLVALEEPIDVQIKAEEARAEAEKLAKLEAERLRVEAIQQKIQQIRDVPAGLVGKPSVIIAGQLAKLRETALDEAELGADYLTATDALAAAIARAQDLLAAQKDAEAEQAKIKAEREELERVRAENERLQREADERAAADRAEADRKAQAERERVAEEQRLRESRLAKIERIRNPLQYPDAVLASADLRAAIERGAELARTEFTAANWGDLLDEVEAAWSEAHDTLNGALQAAIAREQAEAEEHAQHEAQEVADKAAREEEEARLQAERERQATEQRKLDEQAAQLKREQQEAAAKAEADRLANLGLREAAQAVVSHFHAKPRPTVIDDLAAALANDENRTAKAVTVNRTKRAARA